MPDRALDSFVDPGGLLDFWEQEYLEKYVGHGGGSVKWLRGREGSGKTRFLAALRESARQFGYLTAYADAATGSVGRFDDLYREMMGRAAMDDLARGIARHAARRVGAGSWNPDERLTVEDYLRREGRPTGAVEEDIARCLDFLYESRNVDAPVAAAAKRLALPYVSDGENAREQAAMAERWLRGEKLRAGERKQTGIYLALDRYSARDVLRSVLQLLQIVHLPGMVWTVDRLESVVAKRGTAALGSGDDHPPMGVRYTAQRRLDAYEGIRELIDEGGGLPGLLVVYAGRPEVFDDERAGLASYPALAMRVQTEIDADAINRYNDVQDLDRLWQSDWPRHQEALIEAYAGGKDAPEVVDLSGVLSGTAISPVRRLVDWLLGSQTGQEEEAHA